MTRLLFLLAALASSTSALAKSEQPPEPSQKPNFVEVAREALRIQAAQLYDPASIQVQWTSGFEWGFLKAPFLRRTYGWIACGEINAKNRLGGYVGYKPFLVFVDIKGAVTTDELTSWISTCDKSQRAPVMPDLLRLQAAPSSGTPTLSDQLSALASLRESGALTEEEFSAAKTKLLGAQ